MSYNNVEQCSKQRSINRRNNMKIKKILSTSIANIQIKTIFLTRTVESSILISSTLKDAWKALTDFENWNEWNTFISNVNGEFSIGNTISITVHTPGMKSSVFKPVVYDIKEEKQISWGGKAVLVGFEGVHHFYLKQVNNNTICFTQVETFKGPVVLMMGKMLNKIAKGYENMNNELKQYLESHK